MELLEAPVTALPHIGPKYKKLLEKLEIYKVEDLLYHVPFRYDDFSQIKDIAQLQNGETVTVKAVLGPVDNIYTRYGKRLTKSTAADHSGKLNLIWFNQHYIKNTLQSGSTYLISGKVGTFNNKLGMISPELELEDSGALNTGRLVPIYPETLGVSSKWLRARINDVIRANTKLVDPIPTVIKREYDLKDLGWAVKTAHFPENATQVDDAIYRLSFDELFYDLLEVEVRKRDWKAKRKSYEFKPYETKMQNFIKSLPFQLTDSQVQAVKEIAHDMQKQTPMNRLLEGDVGTGKTVVATIGAFLTHLNGYKTIYLAPTEILAQQHFDTLNTFLKSTGMKVELLTRSEKKPGKTFDIIIGTHALLFNKDVFENVGFVTIDEQHRFGVEQRSSLLDLAQKQKTPHLLTMTATPIPRTLALTLYGDLALSALKTHPLTERKVVTKVVPDAGRQKIYDFIRANNYSTFIVCPFIEESEIESLAEVKAVQKEYEFLKKGPLSSLALDLIHGRMKAADKQRVIDDFRKGKTKVLVATPVIEVGIDIPDATVIVIEGAERYGLASLHQLRGRVGRESGKGYCFVFMSAYSRNSYSRLKNLESINDGLKLSEIDMKLRGKGDIFSTMQHGFKRYKVASLDDFVLMERAKKAAEEVFEHIDQYPEIGKRLETLSKISVKNN